MKRYLCEWSIFWIKTSLQQTSMGFVNDAELEIIENVIWPVMNFHYFLSEISSKLHFKMTRLPRNTQKILYNYQKSDILSPSGAKGSSSNIVFWKGDRNDYWDQKDFKGFFFTQQTWILTKFVIRRIFSKFHPQLQAYLYYNFALNLSFEQFNVKRSIHCRYRHH